MRQEETLPRHALVMRFQKSDITMNADDRCSHKINAVNSAFASLPQRDKFKHVQQDFKLPSSPVQHDNKPSTQQYQIPARASMIRLSNGSRFANIREGTIVCIGINVDEVVILLVRIPLFEVVLLEISVVVLALVDVVLLTVLDIGDRDVNVDGAELVPVDAAEEVVADEMVDVLLDDDNGVGVLEEDGVLLMDVTDDDL